jgi:Flp pilus assembly protein TadB
VDTRRSGRAGGKMLAAPWIAVTPTASVAVIAVIIAVAVVASLVARRRERRFHAALPGA